MLGIFNTQNLLESTLFRRFRSTKVVRRALARMIVAGHSRDDVKDEHKKMTGRTMTE